MDKIFIKLSILILKKLESVSLIELTVSHYEFSHQRLRPPSFNGHIRISQLGPVNICQTIFDGQFPQFWPIDLTNQFGPSHFVRLFRIDQFWPTILNQPILTVSFETVILDRPIVGLFSSSHSGCENCLFNIFWEIGAFPFYPVVDVCTVVLGGASWCSLSRISIRSSLSTTQKMFIHYYF